MATFLFKILPERNSLLKELKKNYPEADSFSLYTHLWMRLIGASLNDNIENYLRKLDMSSGRFLLLMFLEVNPHGMKPSEIAANLSVTQATITGLIDGLVQTGFVVRKEHEKDRRACIVSLTEKGSAFMRKNRPEFNRHLESIYKPLSGSEQLQLVDLCEKLFSSLRPQAPSPANDSI